MNYTELRQIRHLVTLGRLLSFTKAAKELGITQPALTRSIQTIEDRAQVRLFDRDRGRVTLTQVGRAYLKQAEGLLRVAEDLDRMLYQSAAGEIGDVEFAMTSAVARALMPTILAEDLRARPDLKSRIHILSPGRIIELVQSEEIEFCVCGELRDQPASLKTTHIGTFPLSLLVRAGHPLLDGFDDYDLTDYPLILSGQVSTSGRIAELARPLVLSPPTVVMDEIGSLVSIASKSDAIWLTIPNAAADAIHHGLLQELPLPNSMDLRFRAVMYSHNRRTLSPAAKRLLERMRDEAARIGAQDS